MYSLKKTKKNEADVVYYDDILGDEFSSAKINAKTIDAKYQYVTTCLPKRVMAFLGYKLVALPIAYCYMKLHFAHRVIGRENLKNEKSAFFLYGNHTQDVGDAVMPALLCRPRKAYVIVHPNNVSMPWLGRLTPYLGALPLPDDMASTRNFIKAIEQRISEGFPVAIYPEAHIWPYYIGIRPFGDAAFQYPVRYDKPVYCFTDTYQSAKNGKVRMVTYIDGPFYPDKSLHAPERRRDIRNKVFEAMTERAKSSNVEVVRYLKRTEDTRND